MKKLTFFIIATIFLTGCVENDDLPSSNRLNHFLTGKMVHKIIYNDFRKTIWVMVSTPKDAPSVSCSPFASLNFYLVKIEGENYKVAEKIPMITDWTICQKHNLWILSENQVKQVVDIHSPLSVYTEEEGYLNSLVGDSKGNLWACGFDSGILKMDENLNWSRYTPANSNLPSLAAKKLVIGEDDTKWVSFDDGNLSLMRLTDNESWDHFICENDGPFCESSTLCGVDEMGDLLLSFHGHEQAGITYFDGENYEEINVSNDEGLSINGTVMKVIIEEDMYYCLVWDSDNNKTFITRYSGNNWTTVYTANNIFDFEIVENEVWIANVDEGLVVMGF